MTTECRPTTTRHIKQNATVSSVNNTIIDLLPTRQNAVLLTFLKFIFPVTFSVTVLLKLKLSVSHRFANYTVSQKTSLFVIFHIFAKY